MAASPTFSFAKPGKKPAGTIVVLAGPDLKLGPQAVQLGAEEVLRRAAEQAGFKGKAMATLDILAPANPAVDRLVVIGTGDPAELGERGWLRLGGSAMGGLSRAKTATVLLERPDGGPPSHAEAVQFCMGAALRAYAFDKYKKPKEDEPTPVKNLAISVLCDDPATVRRAWSDTRAVVEGVVLARDLVNEPPNVLGPVEFAERAAALRSEGAAVEILAEKELRKIGMTALLGVAQGSSRPPRVVIMRWNGGKAKEKPVIFIGKGVVFDSGGISIKPGAGMEDMKGDMAGAAAVTGVMSALVGRKAKVNAVGIIGLVENMPDGAAQRPGDIVTALNGKTIEIVNTDAEGRLVLADLLAYAEERFKPRLMIDLATLTGAIVVALGNHNAGLFASDDALAEGLIAAGKATGEDVWRMPLGTDYDKLIDSKFADMKNVGGRAAGSVTAAQFLRRFVKDTPWAHLDVAGTAMGSPQTEINRSWASGWGVRLLDRLVADSYEVK